MPNAVIEIESDHEESEKTLTPASQKLADDVACVDAAPALSCEFVFSAVLAAGKCQRFKLGLISITLSEAGDGSHDDSTEVPVEAELQLAQVKVLTKAVSQVARLPIVNVIRFHVKHDREIHILLSSPLDASKLGWPPVKHATSLADFVLVFSPPEIPTALATLCGWLPHFSKLFLGWRGLTNLPGAEVLPLTLHGVTLTVGDVKLLGEETWLNDKCLDFFMKLALELVAPENLRDQIWVIDSLFYQQLVGSGATSGELGWQNVCGWRQFRGEGVLGRPYLFLPMNLENTHWWLAVVCNPLRALERRPGDTFTKGESPRIVCLDSSLEPEPKTAPVGFLRGYVWREWCRHGNLDAASATALSKRSTLSTGLKMIDANVPKQLNGHDCGIFLIEYLLHIFQSKSALLAIGLVAHKHWFRQDVVSHRRRCLRLVAAKLQAEANRCGESDVGKLLLDESLRRTLREVFVSKPLGQCPQAVKRKAPG